jgi:anti-sigma regulatory factor (Ser/Thr protein kinase)
MEGFQSTLPPDFAVLAGLRRSLATWLERAGVPDPRRADVVLATHEAAANAIEHAGCAGPVGVRARLAHGALTIEISDQGRWKAGGLADEERGRGLKLIAGLVSNVEIDMDAGGTTLRLVQHDAVPRRGGARPCAVPSTG